MFRELLSKCLKLNNEENEVMTQKYKIDPKYIGTVPSLMILPTCVVWLMLDRTQASPVVCAVAWTLWSVLVLCRLIAPLYENHVHPRHLPIN